MNQFLITISNDTNILTKEVKVQTFAEAAREAYFFKNIKGFQWRILSVEMRKQ
jgi:hypothetical protein